MSNILRNSCDVVTLTPMNVNCNTVNASAIDSQDGSAQLFINGGTPPYTITWSNGQQGNVLNNLSPGDYTATVTDYYNDNQIVTTCTVGFNSQYLDKFIKCDDTLNSDIFVFYDGTSLNVQKAKTACESIRTWYKNKFDNGYGGLLYEGVVGSVDNNGENWLWWSTYPYLGSLTGGTLSDSTTVTSFGLNGSAASNSIYDSRWCSSNLNAECVPNNPSFNFGTEIPGGFISDIYKRINNGYELEGPYGVNDNRSQGVPFTVTSQMDGNYETVYGDFVGGVTDYLVIIVTDESDGSIGFYHGDVPSTPAGPDKNYLFTNPFKLYGDGWLNPNVQEPTNRFTYEYDIFLKVWKDIKNSGGSFNGLLYPYIDNDTSEIPFIQHAVAAIEGDSISATTFLSEYGQSINSVGYLNLNLSALTETNVYSGLTSTNAYYNLNPEDKKGAGLKNFGWVVDPKVSAYSLSEITSAVEPFFDGSSLTNEYVYSTVINGLTQNRIYNFTSINGCYSYDSRSLSTGQTFSNLTVSNSYDDCINCNPSPPNNPIQPKLCLTSNQTQYTFTQNGVDVNNNFVWVNNSSSTTIQYSTTNDRWEITPWNNLGTGLMVQNSNNTIPTGSWQNIGNPIPKSWNMTEGECDGLTAELNALTSDEVCEDENNGSVILTIDGGTPPFVFRVQNIPPYPAYTPSGLFTNLQPGTYIAEASGTTGIISTSFNIGEGSSSVEYILTTTYQLVSQRDGTKSWNYTVEVDPPLPSSVSITFDLKLTHQRISRDSGDAIFSQSHTITKNGNLIIPYTTSTPVINETNVCNGNVVQSNEIFIQTAQSIQMNSTDTLVGSVIQTVIIDGQDAECEPEDCQMLGEYITSLQLVNLRLTGANSCDSISYPNPLTNINIRLQDCQ